MNFKDLNDRNWCLALNIGLARKLKEQLGFDVFQLDETLIEAMLGDMNGFATMLAVICEPQYSKHGITESEFFEALDADTIYKAGKAFDEALINFTPPSNREATRIAITKSREAMEKAAEILLEKTQSQFGESSIVALLDGVSALMDSPSEDSSTDVMSTQNI